MKLFKKLAAAALAAVLALTMVGCGSSASLKDELLKVAMDQMTMTGSTATHSKELDALAARLVQEADKAAGQDAHKGDAAKTILTWRLPASTPMQTGISSMQLRMFSSRAAERIWSSSRWSGWGMPSTLIRRTINPTKP